MEFKAFPFLVLKTDEGLGIVEHLINVFGIEDLGGDIVHAGAFEGTDVSKVRVLDSHNRATTLSVIGVPLILKEIGRSSLPVEVREKFLAATGALWARTQFLMNTPEGEGVFKRIKAGAISEFSFGYKTLEHDFSDAADGHRVRNLRKVQMYEYSPVLWGMNQATAVTNVKEVREQESLRMIRLIEVEQALLDSVRHI